MTSIDKNSAKCCIAPALCLHITNLMKSSVTHVHWVVHEILSVLYFAIFIVTTEVAILDGQFVKKISDINLKQLYLQIILIERD